MLNKIKQLNRTIRTVKKKAKLSFYCQRYDKAPQPSLPFEDIKTLALLRWDNKLGDAIMSGLFIQAVQKARPDIQISVITPEFCAHWLKQATNCNIIPCGKRGTKTAQSLRQYRNQFDAVIDLGTSFDFKELIAFHELEASYNIGFNKENHPIFNVHIPQQAIHFKDRYLVAANLFTEAQENQSIPLIPLIPFSQEIVVKTQGVNVAMNLFGSSKYRQFSQTEAKKLISHWLNDFLNDYLYLIPVPGKMDFLQQLVKEFNNERVLLAGDTPSLAFSLQLLSQVDLCFTPDTSVVHMASALNTPILAIYADDPKNFQEWHPLSDKQQVIFNPAAKDKNDRVYVHDFSWAELKQKRDSLMTKVTVDSL